MFQKNLYNRELSTPTTAETPQLVASTLPQSPVLADADTPGSAVSQRLESLAEHMGVQWKEHHHARKNATQVFNTLLSQLDDVCTTFADSLPDDPTLVKEQVYHRMDADRSVGILNLLWHAVSFTMRGNTKPMALYRHHHAPVFSGRIIAVMGDFMELSHQGSTEPEALLQHEIASLYIPADPQDPALMTIKHLGDEEHTLAQEDAAQHFLLKVVEMVCAGGYFHEQPH